MLGAAIASRRKSIGLTQEALAEQASVSQGTIAQIEVGIIKWPKVETILAIAKALQTTVTSLFREAELIPIDAETEKELAELTSQVPEFAELFEIAREVNKEHPENLRELVRYAKWLLEKELQGGVGSTRGQI